MQNLIIDHTNSFHIIKLILVIYYFNLLTTAIPAIYTSTYVNKMQLNQTLSIDN